MIALELGHSCEVRNYHTLQNLKRYYEGAISIYLLFKYT
jgi:hypothetical protein